MITLFKKTKLKNIAKIYSGNSINEKIKEKNYTGIENGVDYISTKDIGFNHSINYNNGVKIPFNKIESFKTAPKNTVFICAEGGSAGRKIAISDRELCFVNKLFSIVASDKVIYKYIFYSLISQDFLSQFRTQSTGIIGGVSLNKFKELEISLPPLPLQQKIVETLDAIFSEIDKATAAAEANAKNTEALFQSFLNVKMENKDKRWTTRTFDEIVFEKQVGLVKNSNEQVDDGKYSYFKMNNITNDNKCNLKSLIKVNATDEEFRKYRLKKNDFLFNTRNSVELVGKVCIFDGEEDDDILYNNNIMRVRFRPYVNPYFILYAFSNKKVRKSIEKIKTGATNVAAIYYKDLKDLTIHIPDLETQNEIVSQIQKISSFINVLSKKLKNKISNLTSLKQSILKKAFAGELIKAA